MRGARSGAIVIGMEPLDTTTSLERSGLLAVARMAGASIAGRDAAVWITDFLNAAYYRRPAQERELDDLRLAFSILTTYWYAKDAGRLRVTDVSAFHRAFGARRRDTARSARGLLDHAQLLDGATELLGDWFAPAYGDRDRHGWGIVFPTLSARAEYRPERRLALARVGAMTPEHAPLEQQTWHTYPAVDVPSAAHVLALLTQPDRWQDFGSEIGRFTALRSGGLLGQTFEIEVAAGTESGRPVFTRGYVTVTQLVTEPNALDAYFAELEAGLARYGVHEPRATPAGATPVAGLDLTTHAGHFMGSGHNRLIVFEHDGRAYVRAIGTWDPMPWYLAHAYRMAGDDAQHAFWGEGSIERLSMLHQLGLAVT